MKSTTPITGSRLWLALWRTWKTFSLCDEASIAETGLSTTDFAILECLLHRGEQPVGQIGESVLLTSGSISIAIDRLEKRELVRRKPSRSDRRQTMVSLTTVGQEQIRAAYLEHSKNLNVFVDGLEGEERRQLVELLLKLRKQLERRLAQES